MTFQSKENFRRRAKMWLIRHNKTTSDLAALIGRRRDTVSKAINQGRFPGVKAQIMEVISA